MSAEPLYVIWEHRRGAWWMPNCCGYTTNLLDAGVYDAALLKRANTEDGIDEVRPLDEELAKHRKPRSVGEKIDERWTSVFWAEQVMCAEAREIIDAEGNCVEWVDEYDRTHPDGLALKMVRGANARKQGEP